MSRVSVINKPRRIKPGEAGHGTKKFVVKVKKGDRTKTIKYGDAKMEIKRDNPERRKKFSRASWLRYRGGEKQDDRKILVMPQLVTTRGDCHADGRF